MKMNWVTIPTCHFEASKAFYQDFLGLKLDREFSPAPGMRLAFLSDETGMEVELLGKEGEPEAPAAGGVSLGFATDRYEELLAQAKEKGLTQGPVTLGGGMECFFLPDPNGVGIQIIKP